MTDDITTAASRSTTPVAISKDMIGDDHVTVVTAGKPIGKRIFKDTDGYAKAHINDPGRFTARRHCVTLESLADLIADLEPTQALILGYIPVKAMETYRIAPRREIEAALPEGADPHQYGVQDDTGVVVVARLKELFAPSRFALFEHDPHVEMPSHLRVNATPDLLAKLAVLHPPFKDVGYLSYPSSSNRVTDLIGQVLPSGAMHVIVEVDDAAAAEAFGNALYERAWTEGMGYTVRNKTGAPLRRTIFDGAVFQPNRLVFAGPPTAGERLKVSAPAITQRKGTVLDTSGLTRPSAEELSAAMGVTVTQGKGGTYRVLHDLTPETEIETERDGTMTVQDFLDSDAKHVRCQATFRESASWNGYLGKHKDDAPFLFDQGAQEKHMLAAPEPLAKLAAALIAQRGDDSLFTSISDVEFKPIEYLFKPLLPAKANALLLGLPESFKSFLLISWGLTVASGRAQWMGYDVKLHGDVLYICGEGEDGIRARVEAWRLEHRLDMTDLRRFHISKMPLDLCKPDTAEKVHADIVARGLTPRMIIVDTYSANSSGEENSNDSVRDFLKNLRMLQLVHSCLVVVAHHPGHAEQSRARGAAAWKGNVDVDFRLERQGEEGDTPRSMGTVLVPGKSKDGRKEQAVGLRGKSWVIGADADGDDVTSLVLVADAAAVTAAKAKDTNLMRGVLVSLLAEPGLGQDKLAADLVKRKFSDARLPRRKIKSLMAEAEARRYLVSRPSGGGDVTPSGEVWCKQSPFGSNPSL